MRFFWILIIGLLASCSSENENNTTQSTSNQTSSTNNRTNNETNNVTNNKTNNTTNNSTGTTGTTQTTPVPDPFNFTCDEFTPSGELDIVAGNWDIKDLCFFENPFAAFETFCPEIVFTDFEITETEGRVIVELPNFALVDFSAVEVDLVLPKECVATLGGGTCEGTKARIDSLVVANVTCTEFNDACACNIKGEFGTRRTGTLELVAPGTAKTWEFDKDGKVVEDQIQYAITDQGGIFATGSNMDILKVEKGADSTLCETYCTTFLASCNNAPNVESYNGEMDCMEKCALFPTDGSPDVNGNSVQCRISNAKRGSDGTSIDNFATFCPNAQNEPIEVCVDPN